MLRKLHPGRWLRFTQRKNRRRKPINLTIPIQSDLEDIIAASPCGDLTFLVTQFGKGFTNNGFGSWFKKRCREAGLPHCSAHGLRKASATIAAENGASDRQLMAMYGWQTSKQATHYTRSANQTRLAASGMSLLAIDEVDEDED
jgi:integrase